MAVKKILILAANPEETDKLRLDEEARDIKEGLRQSKERDRFTIDAEWAVRPRDIRRVVLYSRPQIVHFSGHGSEDGGLAFEDMVGKIQLVPPQALANLFKLFSEHVECVLLNACYSENQADAISQHIDFVIGMNKGIGDRAAIEFSVGFYDALGAGYSVETAYEFGCNAIHMAGISEHLTPILKCKKGLLLFSSADVLENKTSMRESMTGTTKPEAASKITYEFVLTGSINEISKKKLEAIVTHLQNITGDTSLTLLRVESGSVKLILEGSEDGFREIKKSFDQGNLRNVENISVEDVRRLNLQPISSSSSIQVFGDSGKLSRVVLQDVLDASIDGALILNVKGEVLHINYTALQLLTLLNSNTSEDLPLPPEVGHSCQTLIDNRNLPPNRIRIVEYKIYVGTSHKIRIRAQWIDLENKGDKRILVVLQDEYRSIRQLVLQEPEQYKLTPREAEILQLYQSFNYKEIASQLWISISTVKKHMRNIHSKMQESKIQQSDLRSEAEKVLLQENRRTEQLLTELRSILGEFTVHMQRAVKNR